MNTKSQGRKRDRRESGRKKREHHHERDQSLPVRSLTHPLGRREAERLVEHGGEKSGELRDSIYLVINISRTRNTTKKSQGGLFQRRSVQCKV